MLRSPASLTLSPDPAAPASHMLAHIGAVVVSTPPADPSPCPTNQCFALVSLLTTTLAMLPQNNIQQTLHPDPAQTSQLLTLVP